jgi:dTDP-4-dehydrorhamnose 3,5-epimerase
LEGAVIFERAMIAGAFVVDLERREDERGFFARLWCREEFAAIGLDEPMVQSSISHNRLAGTLRGLHFARSPAREGKLVRCERGRVFDVILDLRPESSTYLRHLSIVLDDERRNALYVPPGVAHGFRASLRVGRRAAAPRNGAACSSASSSRPRSPTCGGSRGAGS